jgi:hypothetical protein
MADALRIRTVISSKTLTISDLDRFVGKRVEVIVLEDDRPESEPPRSPVAPQRRRFGTMAGKIEIADDFDAPLPEEIQKYFDGEGEK